MKKVIALLVVVLIAFLVIGGCVKVGIKGAGAGGVFKSTDKGEHWFQKVGLLTVGKEDRGIGGVNVSAMVFDPTDSQTIYLGTQRYGLFYTYSGADAWQEAKGLPRGEVKAIAVDRQDPARIYAVIGNEIYKTRDCCRHWEKVYFETKARVNITCLAVDPNDSSRIYAGLSDGRLLRSVDAGLSWSNFYDFKNEIYQVLINPVESNLIYAALRGKLFKSINKGANWQDISETLKDYGITTGFRELQFIQGQDSLAMLVKYGILWSDDGGASWRAYKLISRPKEVDIYSLAFNPANPNEIYYSTASALYKTSDGGANWQAKNLPTSRTPVKLLVDPANPSVLYMSVAEIK